MLWVFLVSSLLCCDVVRRCGGAEVFALVCCGPCGVNEPLVFLVRPGSQDFKEVAELDAGLAVQVAADGPAEREQEERLQPLRGLRLGARRLLLLWGPQLQLVQQLVFPPGVGGLPGSGERDDH